MLYVHRSQEHMVSYNQPHGHICLVSWGGTLSLVTQPLLHILDINFTTRPWPQLVTWCEVNRNGKRSSNKRVHQVVTVTVRPTVTTTVVTNTYFVLVVVSHCFTVPYPARKITSHQRNSKKGLFVYTSLSTTLSLTHTHKSKFFSFRFLHESVL